MELRYTPATTPPAPAATKTKIVFVAGIINDEELTD